jgi:methyltransferase (TIGR00027 family)
MQRSKGDPIALSPKPSALGVATLRAAHQLLDDPLVFEDPLALRILGAAGEESLRKDALRYNTPLLRGLRASVAVRSRMAEDAWADAKRRGSRQYVILGAGLDTCAYRSHDLGSSRVFEVDFPATQQWKRDCLHAADIEEPASLTFVPIDFESSTLADALGTAGFHSEEPAFFSWLGVTMYLEEESIRRTLHFIASLAPGTGVLFDYGVVPWLLSPTECRALAALAARGSGHGEPWKTLFDPTSLAGMLTPLGFSEVEDFGPERLNDRYFSGRKDGLHKSGVSRLMQATVGSGILRD